MSRRSRIRAFGSAAALVIAGALCAILVPGLVGQLLTTVLMSLGLGGAVLLVFLEVGLSEDRELERERAQRERAQRGRVSAPPRSATPRRPRRPPRLIRTRRRPG
ncbi:MAG: hypothetical protein ACXVQR_02190 [Solirubrobacteraceae bacterium]